MKLKYIMRKSRNPSQKSIIILRWPESYEAMTNISFQFSSVRMSCILWRVTTSKNCVLFICTVIGVLFCKMKKKFLPICIAKHTYFYVAIWALSPLNIVFTIYLMKISHMFSSNYQTYKMNGTSPNNLTSNANLKSVICPRTYIRLRLHCLFNR